MTTVTIPSSIATIEPIVVDPNGHWSQLSACSGHSELMYPDDIAYDDDLNPIYVLDDKGDVQPIAVDWAPALAICDGCPVRNQCLDQAMQTGDVFFGVLGGMTPEARRKYRSSMREHVIPHATVTGYTNYDCRCDPCMYAYRAATADRKNPIVDVEVEVIDIVANARANTPQELAAESADDELARLIAEQAADDGTEPDTIPLHELDAQTI